MRHRSFRALLCGRPALAGAERRAAQGSWPTTDTAALCEYHCQQNPHCQLFQWHSDGLPAAAWRHKCVMLMDPPESITSTTAAMAEPNNWITAPSYTAGTCAGAMAGDPRGVEGVYPVSDIAQVRATRTLRRAGHSGRALN